MLKQIAWWQISILITILLLFTFSIYGANRPIGASTFVPYLSTMLFNLNPTEYEYSNMIQHSGSWEAIFLVGTFLGALFVSVFITKTFHLKILPKMWIAKKNKSIYSRLIWSFISGFLMIFGARLAGGCMSGHLLSGVTQMAISSVIFGTIVMATLLITGRLFYK